jgi:hypothetical protein
MRSQADKAVLFKSLHERDDAFVIPNPWDPGTARLLALLGFDALATTSAGHAFSIGVRDNAVGRERMIVLLRRNRSILGEPDVAPFRRFHQLTNRVEDHLELCVVFPLESVQLAREIRVGCKELSQLYESAHDEHVDLHSAFTREHGRQHCDTLFREDQGRISTPSTPATF